MALILNAVAGPSTARLLNAAGASSGARTTGRCLTSSAPVSSGHNRWSKIRHRKGAADAQRSSLFSRLTSDIHAALRPPSSPDPLVNNRLATALQKAKEGGVPKHVVEHCFVRARAAAEGTGQSVVYEAVGPSGKEAFMIECITESPPRTVQRLKEILHKHSCRMAPVSFLFEKKGVIVLSPISGSAGLTFDEVFEAAVEAGAEDVKENQDEDGTTFEITTPPTELSSVTNAISASSVGKRANLDSSEISYLTIDALQVGTDPPDESTGDGGLISGGNRIKEDQAEAIDRIISMIEMEGDVVKVWTNVEGT